MLGSCRLMVTSVTIRQVKLRYTCNRVLNGLGLRSDGGDLCIRAVFCRISIFGWRQTPNAVDLCLCFVFLAKFQQRFYAQFSNRNVRRILL